jgi:hypothetical protein
MLKSKLLTIQFFLKMSVLNFLFVTLMGYGTISNAQSRTSLWSDIKGASISSRVQRVIIPEKYRTLKLDINGMKELLSRAPLENPKSARDKNGVIISLPLPDKNFADFYIIEMPVMAPELAAKFPTIKTYSGYGVDDPGLTVALDLTPQGFHAMIHTPEGLLFIDPYGRNTITEYIAYAKEDYKLKPEKAFEEIDVLNTDSETARQIKNLVEEKRRKKNTDIQRRPNGSNLRTYRLAVAATGEYTAFQGGTVAAGLGAINTTINRVNFIYIRELAARMLVVANNNLIVYTNASTDPYTNGNAGTMISQNQTNIDAVIGNANYDIGHVFGTNSGGLAGLGVVCQTGIKANGVTGSAAPVGDPFDVDYVAHEMGHQFGANHSFNGNTGSCAGNRVANKAFEPGSGSTIMAYAGICGAQDLQPNSDAYFHTESYDEIVIYTTLLQGNNCAVLSNANNTAPAPNAGISGLTIPMRTPFTLTGSATDADGDAVFFCWEQYNLGPAGAPNAPVGDAPIFRSFTATSSPSRTFPKLSDILNNIQTLGELLPTYTRSLNFSLQVRDNWFMGGGVDYQNMTVNVTSNSGPFLVTSPNTNTVTWPVNSARNVTWNVANSNLAPVNCSSVKISLSTDGGLTFPIVLVANTPNDGTQLVSVPNVTTTTARVKIEAVGNIFFDISDQNFTITPIQPNDFVMTNFPITSCTGRFFDPGYTGNYDNNQLYFETISPSTSGSKVRVNFSSFNLESGFDFLRIYNGPNALSPLIGTFTGTNSPGIITATNPNGVLSFRFSSDGSVTSSGWVASISCVSSSVAKSGEIGGSIDGSPVHSLVLMPNPASDKLKVKFNALENGKTVLEIIDILGRKVISTDQLSEAGTNEIEINTQKLSEGIYLVKVINGFEYYTTDLVIKK